MLDPHEYIRSRLSWIASGGVQEMEKIYTLDGTTFPAALKPFWGEKLALEQQYGSSEES